MNFRVLEDGTILNKNGLKIGTIQIESDKYKDEILEAIESPFTVDFYRDTKHMLESIKPETMNVRDITEAVKVYGKADEFLVNLIDSIDYYN